MTSNEGGSFQLFNFDGPTLVGWFKKIHPAKVNDFVVLNDNQKVVSGDQMGNTYIWDVTQQEVDFVFPGTSFVR